MEIPPVSSLIESYEKLAGFIRPSKVVGMAIDTSKLKEEEAHQLLERYAGLAKMPVTDPVRFGAGKLFDAIEEFCALVNVH